MLLEQREAGAAILLISEDLDEILALADRIAVMYEGRIVGSFSAADADIHEIGLLMTGGGAAAGEPAATAGCGRRAGHDRMSLLARATDRRRRAGCRPCMTFAAFVFALVLSGLIIALVGGDPIRSYLHIVGAAFGSVGVLSDTLVKATPLILTGLACALAFRMRLWNIGAEGQFLLGAWGASAVVLAPILPAGTPAIVVIPAMMLAGALAGGAVGLHPGHPEGAARRQRDHRHPDAQLHRPARGSSSGSSGRGARAASSRPKPFPREAWLPRLTDFATVVPGLGGLTIHLGLVFGLVCAAIMWVAARARRAGATRSG